MTKAHTPAALATTEKTDPLKDCAVRYLGMSPSGVALADRLRARDTDKTRKWFDIAINPINTDWKESANQYSLEDPHQASSCHFAQHFSNEGYVKKLETYARNADKTAAALEATGKKSFVVIDCLGRSLYRNDADFTKAYASVLEYLAAYARHGIEVLVVNPSDNKDDRLKVFEKQQLLGAGATIIESDYPNGHMSVSTQAIEQALVAAAERTGAAQARG